MLITNIFINNIIFINISIISYYYFHYYWLRHWYFAAILFLLRFLHYATLMPPHYFAFSPLLWYIIDITPFLLTFSLIFHFDYAIIAIIITLYAIIDYYLLFRYICLWLTIFSRFITFYAISSLFSLLSSIIIWLFSLYDISSFYAIDATLLMPLICCHLRHYWWLRHYDALSTPCWCWHCHAFTLLTLLCFHYYDTLSLLISLILRYYFAIAITPIFATLRHYAIVDYAIATLRFIIRHTLIAADYAIISLFTLMPLFSPIIMPLISLSYYAIITPLSLQYHH